MTPDEVMLRNVRSGKDITPPWDVSPRPLTPEELAAFGSRPSGIRLPNPCPFVKIGPGRKGRGVEVVVGIKGEF